MLVEVVAGTEAIPEDVEAPVGAEVVAELVEVAVEDVLADVAKLLVELDPLALDVSETSPSEASADARTPKEVSVRSTTRTERTRLIRRASRRCEGVWPWRIRREVRERLNLFAMNHLRGEDVVTAAAQGPAFLRGEDVVTAAAHGPIFRKVKMW